MTLRPVPPTPDGSDDEGADFDPSNYAIVITHSAVTSLELYGDSDEYIRDFTARVYQSATEVDFVPKPELLVASADFQHIGFDAWGGDGWSKKFDFADAQSGDLLDVAEALFDDEGDTKAELDVAHPGGDLLYIRMVEVQSGHDVFELIRHLLENIIERYGHGCMGVAYYQANWESIGVARPLKDRGFAQLPGSRNIWFLDLGKKRPALDGDEEGPT